MNRQNTLEPSTKAFSIRMLSTYRPRSIYGRQTRRNGYLKRSKYRLPATWGLTPGHSALIPTENAENVVFTLTDCSQRPSASIALVKQLQKHYSRVCFWPQGVRDRAYLEKLPLTDVHTLPPTLEAFDALLAGNDSLDYVGTRLHAGIRALQHKRRGLILRVDNRATEIKIDMQAITAWKQKF